LCYTIEPSFFKTKQCFSVSKFLDVEEETLEVGYVLFIIHSLFRKGGVKQMENVSNIASLI